MERIFLETQKDFFKQKQDLYFCKLKTTYVVRKKASFASTNKVLISENDYLKKVLDINKPILETETENSSYRITKVTSNKAGKNIEISFLIESKDENKKMTIEDITIVDIEGNEHKTDLYKSSKTFPELAKNIPLKLGLIVKNSW
ncbi:MAG TPA: hypothetical protein VF455_00675 [Chryseobacterium sp.]